jgi:IS30 family transposase
MTPDLIALIETQLAQKWSPEQISGWLFKTQGIRLSHERIYQHIWLDKRVVFGILNQFLINLRFRTLHVDKAI